MPYSDYEHCEVSHPWNWTEAFEKFGFNDGDGVVHTWDVGEALATAGYEIEIDHWGLHNTVITSVKTAGRELIPYDNPEYQFGYDDPRSFFPGELVELLDRKFPAQGGDHA